MGKTSKKGKNLDMWREIWNFIQSLFSFANFWSALKQTKRKATTEGMLGWILSFSSGIEHTTCEMRWCFISSLTLSLQFFSLSCLLVMMIEKDQIPRKEKMEQKKAKLRSWSEDEERIFCFFAKNEVFSSGKGKGQDIYIGLHKN